MGLTGEAYFFAYLGFLLMVLVGWLILPRVSFIVTMAVLVEKIGLINMNSNFLGGYEILDFILILLTCIIGFLIDITVLINKVEDLINKGTD